MCLNPIILKSGLAVPCGKCDICRSDNRCEWTTRLAIHAIYSDRMPLFVTFTYDNEHIPLTIDDGETVVRDLGKYPLYFPTLYRPDMSAFLKAYKRKYGLSNQKFQYFGCGEYGDKFGRPHYHLLMFGDDELYDLYLQDSHAAEERVKSVWKYGNVFVCIADWSGIHYVTKYVLKDGIGDVPPCSRLPFTIGSKNLGNAFLHSPVAEMWRRQLEYLTVHREEIYAECPYFDVSSRYSVLQALRYFKKYVPNFKVLLDSGKKVPLPRSLRRKLVGSFEHFQDSPLWLVNYLQMCLRSIDYYSEYSEFDEVHDINASLQQMYLRCEKIRKRLLEKKYNKLNETI